MTEPSTREEGDDGPPLAAKVHNNQLLGNSNGEEDGEGKVGEEENGKEEDGEEEIGETEDVDEENGKEDVDEENGKEDD